nr:MULTISPECIES: hypothetical protein [unclassified Streptomyces]
MKALLVLVVLVVVCGVPTVGVWLLGRRARVPAWMVAVFLLAGWVTVVVGGGLALRAQPGLFPEASPCHGVGAPVSRYFPPDSFCRHDDGELRSVNGPAAKFVFWTATGTVLAVPVAAFMRRRVPPAPGPDSLMGASRADRRG